MTVDLGNLEASSEQEPYIRLMVCRTCKSIDELPPYQGPPEGDVLLQMTIERHGENHVGLLINVGAIHWNSKTMRAAIIEQIQQGSSGLDVFGTAFYETKMQFAEDAMSCWGQYNRPKGQCPDFRSEKKRLLPKTDVERKDAGLASVQQSNATRIYLCDFCPVRVYNERKSRDEKGLYK
jgi:predicted metal-binding protein